MIGAKDRFYLVMKPYKDTLAVILQNGFKRYLKTDFYTKITHICKKLVSFIRIIHRGSMILATLEPSNIIVEEER